MADQNPQQTNQANGAQAPDPTAQQGGKTFTQEQLDVIIADRLQRERGKYADYEELKKAKTELDTLKQGQLSEAQKLQQRAETAEAEAKTAREQIRAANLRMAIEREARKLAIVDEDAAFRLLDLAAVQYDAASTPTNIEPLLRALVAKRPYLVGQAGGNSGSLTNPARGGNAKLTLDDIRKMGPEEINRRWDEVQRVMAGQ
jgi:hypothetical protein